MTVGYLASGPLHYITNFHIEVCHQAKIFRLIYQAWLNTKNIEMIKLCENDIYNKLICVAEMNRMK